MNNAVIVLQVLKSHTSTRKTASVPAAEPGGSCTWMEVIMWRDLEQKTWTHHVFGTFQDASWVKSPLVPWQSDEIISEKCAYIDFDILSSFDRILEYWNSLIVVCANK